MARHLGAAGRIAEEQDKAVTVRPSSTALLSVDSLDREQTLLNQSSANFTINKNQSLFNGFFTRVAMNEIVLDWCIPNVSQYAGNNTLSVTVGPTTAIVSIPTGFYNIAECLDALVTALNDPGAFGVGFFRVEDKTGGAWNVGTSTGLAYLGTTAGGNFTINPTELALELGLQTGTSGAAFPVTCPKLLPYYYIDFVSPQLTYNQDLKDNTTSSIVRDSLYRWVFAYDNAPTPLDKYLYPVLQGYKEFVTRRYLNYPKQILWNPAMPLGQLSFQVYTSFGDLLDPTALSGEMEYQMSLLFSEN